MNKRHYEHTLPNIRGSLSNTYVVSSDRVSVCLPWVKPFSASGYYVLLPQDVYPTVMGRTFHCSRTYVPLPQDVIICRSKRLSRP